MSRARPPPAICCFGRIVAANGLIATGAGGGFSRCGRDDGAGCSGASPTICSLGRIASIARCVATAALTAVSSTFAVVAASEVIVAAPTADDPTRRPNCRRELAGRPRRGRRIFGLQPMPIAVASATDLIALVAAVAVGVNAL